MPSSPFDQQEIDEVHLTDAPLALVLTQVRHPPLVALHGEGGEEVAIRLANRLSGDYPIFEHLQETEIVISPKGVTEGLGPNRIWHLKDASEEWRVSFGQEFVALDTSRYMGRSEFCSRFEALAAAYSEIVRPPNAQRVGVRYFNRIENEAILQNLPALVRPEILGLAAAPLPQDTQIQHVLTQVVYQAGDHAIKGQWGLLPAGAVVDAAMSPVSRRSWILDIDSFLAVQRPFDAELLGVTVRELARRAYRFFRWSVTEEFLTEFGAVR